jgi:two-component system, OmpR family, clock-associated histidine kinase SasA
MAVLSEKSNFAESLQLLLFVDERYCSTSEYYETLNCLDRNALKSHLKIIDVSKQPGLAEHFKLVATPTLIKLSPSPRQVFSGSNLRDELENWLPTWSDDAEVELTETSSEEQNLAKPDREQVQNQNIAHIQTVLEMADEIFHLRQEQRIMQEQLRFKEQAISILAHDLRNPLTAAGLALDTLAIARDPNDLRVAHLQPELMQKLVQRAKEQVMVVDRLVSDILQLSQGAVSEIAIVPQRFNVNELLQSVIQQMVEPFEKKQQEISTDIPQDLPLVYADIERIRQVMINLLDNASKYSAHGRKIKVVALHRTSQKIQISVIDHGIGISASDCDLIFQKYYRMRQHESEEGYGLGLPLCKSIIRAHFGQIWVESSERGSSFHFTLPVYF